MKPLRVAVVGGECTGKTSLCQALGAQLPGPWVAEYVREFVDRFKRAPHAHEQAAILAAQIEREQAALDAAGRSGAGWVVSDSAPIMTAIYSELYFADRSLYAIAERHHAQYAFTLLADIDMPWEPDGLQRDGPAMRAQSHARIRGWLLETNAPFMLVSGNEPARIAAAMQALRALESSSR
jgi:nicotinamide riboside kinase